VPKVSICIPTYKRPELLRIAIDSCLAQTFQDFEILIGDDSPDMQTEKMVGELCFAQAIRYTRNVPRCGQAGNINQLFGQAKGEFLVLLHDDDMLEPTALEDLITPLEGNPDVVASFGKQYVISDEGIILNSESEAMNRKYFRTNEAANRLQPSTWSALVQQFPCNGYMIRTSAARATLFRDDSEVGQACDAEFGYRLSQSGNFFFVGKYTSRYRKTKDSISSNGLRIHLSKLYFLLRKLSVPRDLEDVRRARLKEVAPVAVNGCLLTSRRTTALRILFGDDYPWSQQFAKGIIQLGLIFVPRMVSGIVIGGKLRQE
jgi:GT2 family glycosyltransferase